MQPGHTMQSRCGCGAPMATSTCQSRAPWPKRALLRWSSARPTPQVGLLSAMSFGMFQAYLLESLSLSRCFTRDLESPAVSKCAVVHPCLR